MCFYTLSLHDALPIEGDCDVLAGYVDFPEGIGVTIFIFQADVEDGAVVSAQVDSLSGAVAHYVIAQYVFFPALGFGGADVHVHDGVAGTVGDVHVVVGGKGGAGEQHDQGGKSQSVEAHMDKSFWSDRLPRWAVGFSWLESAQLKHKCLRLV